MTEPNEEQMDDNGAVAVVEPDEARPITPAHGDQPEGVYYLSDGRVRFVIDGAPYTLRNPRIGQFKFLHRSWVEAAGNEPAVQLAAQLKWVRTMFNGDPDSDPPFAGLSDHPLPEDEDVWPSWVGVAAWQLKVMTHFREVPLALGGTAAGQ